MDLDTVELDPVLDRPEIRELLRGDLPFRRAHLYTKDKLGILEYYIPGFGIACRKKAPNFQIVDAFCGPGINWIEGDQPALTRGSPLLALDSNPPAGKCLFMDLDPANTRTLSLLVRPHGPRAVVVNADTNKMLLPTMQEHLDPRQPTLCVLDPEGPDLHWTTVRGVSRFRHGPRKVEQLILLPTHLGFLRMLPTSPDEKIKPWAEEKIDRMYGTREWRTIYARRLRGDISTEDATSLYVALYGSQLRGLGYAHVSSREIRDRGAKGALRYFLVFATDHPAGDRIMQSAFDRVFQHEEPQLKLFPDQRRDPLR